MTRPPRLPVRTLVVTSLAAAAFLTVTFVALTIDVRDRVRSAETEKLEVAERMFTAFEARWQHHQLATIGILAESPALQAALDTWEAESRFGALEPEQEDLLRRTVAREAQKLAAAAEADAVAVLDAHDRVFASAGRLADRWSVGDALGIGAAGPTFQGVVVLPAGAFRVSGVQLRLNDPDFGTRTVGRLILATGLDAAYAQELAGWSRAGILITVGDAVVASTVEDAVAHALVSDHQAADTSRVLAGEEYVARTLLASDQVRIHMLAPVDEAAHEATRRTLRRLGGIAFGSLALAGLAGLWFARTAAAHTQPLPRPGIDATAADAQPSEADGANGELTPERTPAPRTSTPPSQ